MKYEIQVKVEPKVKPTLKFPVSKIKLEKNATIAALCFVNNFNSGATYFTVWIS